jgi:hypothetical protein
MKVKTTAVDIITKEGMAAVTERYIHLTFSEHAS